MYAFTYHRPSDLHQAQELLGACPEAVLLAGGHTLIPALKQRLASPSDVVDIGRLEALKGLALDGGRLVIGAGETHAGVAAAPLVRQHIPALAHLAGKIGDPHVRHMGTLGGAVANNDPAADYPAACLALEAIVHTTERQIPAADFFTGMFETALEPTEIITKVSFAIPQCAGYEKFPNPASRFALVGVFVARFAPAVHVAVTGAGAKVFRAADLERALGASFQPQAARSVTLPADELNDDIHASADYRAHLVSVMAGRAVAQALAKRAGGS